MTIVGGGINTFWVSEEDMPAQIAFFVGLRIVGGEDEWKDAHEFGINLLRPDLEEEEMLSVSLEMPELPPLKQPGREAGIMLNPVVQWIAHDYGLFSLQLLLDRHREQAIPVDVRPASDLQQQM